jgi:hypothetical protein
MAGREHSPSVPLDLEGIDWSEREAGVRLPVTSTGFPPHSSDALHGKNVTGSLSSEAAPVNSAVRRATDAAHHAQRLAGPLSHLPGFPRR